MSVQTCVSETGRGWMSWVCLGVITVSIVVAFVVAWCEEGDALGALRAHMSGGPFEEVRLKHGAPDEIILNAASWKWMGIAQDPGPSGTDQIAVYQVATKAAAFFIDADGVILEVRTLHSD